MKKGSYQLRTIKKLPVPSKKRKYGNKKVQFDGYRFDSIAEKDYYILHRKDKNMKMQVPFVLTETMKFDGKTIRKMTYTPDFVFYNDDGTIKKVVDVKGFATDTFKVKAKVFMAKYNIPLYLAIKDKKTGMFIEKIV